MRRYIEKLRLSIRRKTGASNSRRSAGDYKPRPVSKYFRFDWNYALRIVRVRYLQIVPQVLVSTPLLIPFFPVLDLNKPQVWLLWVASAVFLLGYAILKVRAPKFLQEWQNYDSFRAGGHSHRWVVWLFHKEIAKLGSRDQVLRETIDKQLSVSTGHLHGELGVYDACPVFEKPVSNASKILGPVNLNNDIYLPFHLLGARYVLPVQESDPKLDRREKELFWIIYSACASTHPKSRITVWACFYIAAALFGIGLIIIGHAMLTAPRTPHLYYI